MKMEKGKKVKRSAITAAYGSLYERLCRRQQIDRHCTLRVSHWHRIPKAPPGIRRLYALVLPKASEALIQPQFCPPWHRDQIAKPAVRDLVSDNSRHTLNVSRTGGIVKQQSSLPECDESPVLSSTAGIIGNCDEVELL